MLQSFRRLPKTRAEAARHGIDRIFTGKPCRYGHIAPRYTSSPNCIKCQLEHARKNGGWNARQEKSAFLARARKTVEQRGGELLSKAYVSAKTKLQVRCQRSHRFKITPDNLDRGRWCSKCKFEDHAERQAAEFLPLATLAEIARERFSGTCLATAPVPMC